MRLVVLLLLAACNGRQATKPPAKPTSGFVYVEARDELTFTAPTKLLLARASGRACDSQLSTGNDNMWTGPDVEAALADADVEAIVARGATVSFIPDADANGVTVEATLRIGQATIEWKPKPCPQCVAQPAGVAHLHSVVVSVMMNRRLLCP
jgi:hypothetical protein